MQQNQTRNNKPRDIHRSGLFLQPQGLNVHSTIKGTYSGVQWDFFWHCTY